MRRPVAGLLVLYVPFYEKIVPLREEKIKFSEEVRGKLAEHCDLVFPGLIETEEQAAAAAGSFESADLVIVVPSLAVFGALGWAALEPLNKPVAVWAIQPATAIPEGYDICELIRNSGALGVQALANTLARHERMYATFFSAGDATVPHRLIRFARVAATARDLRRATFGQIGSVFPQMTDIRMDHDGWTAQTGSCIVEISSKDFTRRYRAQSESQAAARVAEIRGGHTVAEITGDELDRSARISLALDEVVDEFGLAGGAFNCHGENCLQNPEIGVTGCYAVSRQSSAGRPFSCTGDLPTAIALFIAKSLGGAAVYGELDLVDPAAGLVLLANGGEGDFTAAAGPTDIIGNENFTGLHGRGASIGMRMAPGPATILSFTPVDAARAYRMVTAEGELLPLSSPRLGVFHGAFRFCGLSAAVGFESWCDAGATHHLALMPGHWNEEIGILCRMLGFEHVRAGGPHASER